MQREPSTLSRDISPPPSRKASVRPQEPNAAPSLAAIEAGQAEIRDHLEYFAEHLEAVRRVRLTPSLGINNFRALYKRNEHERGGHFVIHQHDHPISGVHYDLRLQISGTSSVSWAVPYGMPGNPNSQKPNRMAIETRVHNLWNNLIESASHTTGSLLIWDTGEYEVLPRRPQRARMTDDELSDEAMSVDEPILSHSERLFAAFQQRHIKLRLHGTKLPPNYTISLRLPSANDRSVQPGRPKRKRRRLQPNMLRMTAEAQTDSEDERTSDHPGLSDGLLDQADDAANGEAAAEASEGESEDAVIRANNAYTGASNTIGSVHQRHWFLTLDRRNSGFCKTSSGKWEGNWEPFFVRGRGAERSVVTGRSADEVMADEGVGKFAGRKMWRPILE